jgi:hypothetical protein
MQLRFLGTDSDRTGCPAMHATDRGSLAVQGRWLRDIGDQAVVEIDGALVRHLIGHVPANRNGGGGFTATATGYAVQGMKVVDPDALRDADETAGLAADEAVVEIGAEVAARLVEDYQAHTGR